MPVRIDLVELHAEEYAAARAPRVVTAGPARFLSLAGRGEPGGPLFQQQVRYLHRTAAVLRGRIRRGRGKDFKLPPVEALWWEDGGRGAPPDETTAANWKLLLRMPSFVRPRDLSGAIEALHDPEAAGRVGAVRLEDLKEGRCVQALHVGPWSERGDTLARMRRAAADLDLAFHGRRHEVYLSDPRRVAPDRARTLLRMPVRAARKATSPPRGPSPSPRRDASR